MTPRLSRQGPKPIVGNTVREGAGSASRALSAYQPDEARSDINFVWRSICDTRAPQERVPIAGGRLAELRAQPRGLRGMGFNRVGTRCPRMSEESHW